MKALGHFSVRFGPSMHYAIAASSGLISDAARSPEARAEGVLVPILDSLAQSQREVTELH